jgi:hypothetical protein
MKASKTYHVIPAKSGEWTIAADEESDASNVYSSQSLAVARAWELVQDRTTAEVVVHGADGSILSNLSIRRVVPIDDVEDELLRQEAIRISPSRSDLDWLIDRLPPSKIHYDEEDDELPC